MKKTLQDLFEVDKKNKVNNYITDDYSIFEDKALLDTLRNKIIQNIIDNNIPDSKFLDEYINNEIDTTIEVYDLTNLERNHIYNLIENEISGYGPLTELLDDDNITEIMVNSPN